MEEFLKWCLEKVFNLPCESTNLESPRSWHASPLPMPFNARIWTSSIASESRHDSFHSWKGSPLLLIPLLVLQIYYSLLFLFGEKPNITGAHAQVSRQPMFFLCRQAFPISAPTVKLLFQTRELRITYKHQDKHQDKHPHLESKQKAHLSKFSFLAAKLAGARQSWLRLHLYFFARPKH